MKSIKNFEEQKLKNEELIAIKGGGFWDDFADGNADGVGAGDGPETGRNWAYWIGYGIGKTAKEMGGGM